LQAAVSAGADAIYFGADSLVTNGRHRLGQLTLQHRLPSIFDFPENARAGGLLSYGASLVDNYRRAAKYVDKILKGARPADLPVEPPNIIELAINLKTHRSLGLTILHSVLEQATKIMQ
jgi:putative tryptophan/tyrosine transport system substrate-binding protein